MSNQNTTNIGDIAEDDSVEYHDTNTKNKPQLTIKTKQNVGFQLPEDKPEEKKPQFDSKVEPTIHDLSLLIDDFSQYNSILSLNTPGDEKKSPRLFTKDEGDDSIYEVIFPIPEEKLKKGSNYIRTTKYTLWSFLPLNLISQVNHIHIHIHPHIYIYINICKICISIS